jgi:hypothetical protein
VAIERKMKHRSERLPGSTVYFARWGYFELTRVSAHIAPADVRSQLVVETVAHQARCSDGYRNDEAGKFGAIFCRVEAREWLCVIAPIFTLVSWPWFGPVRGAVR